jgi:hypothetical protein
MPALKSVKDASIEDIEARLSELKQEFVDMAEGRRSEVDDDGLRSMIREVDMLDTMITMLSAEEERAQRKQRLASLIGPGDKGVRSIGEAFCTPEAVDFILNGRRGGGEDGFRSTFEGNEAKQLRNFLDWSGRYGGAHYEEGLRAVTEWGAGGPPTFDSTDSGGLLPRLGQPIAPVPRQAKLYMRDLMPNMTTTLATMPYVQELNPTTGESVTGGGATTVAEGSVKPSATLSFVSQNAPLTVIATTLTLSKQMFEDNPAVIAYINQRLPYLVKFREDAEYLNGSGTWPDMGGITNTSGVQTYQNGPEANGDYAQQIGNAFAYVENQDGTPTAVVMNPFDAWAMFVKRAAAGSGTFDAGTPFAALPLTVWGVPSYRSRAYARGQALVSDFERGGMVVDREQVNTQIYRERYAEQNLVLLICEERTSAMWFRPDLFVKAVLH